MQYDIIIIGSGPGGYVAAIRGAQLGYKVAIVEKEHLGGICLNWGCIPTKALLRSAQIYAGATHAADFGVQISGEITPDFEKIVARSRAVAEGMSKGVQFLLKKNKIDVIWGRGVVTSAGKVEVALNEGGSTLLEAPNILLATGARSRELPNMPQDGKKVIGYRQALSLPALPKSMVVCGSGAIGSELAFLYQTLGTQVTLVEYMPEILPIEDEEVSKLMARSFKKIGMKVMTSATVESVDTSGPLCKVTVKTAKGESLHEAEMVLSAVGITPNLENLGLEALSVAMEKGKIKVDEVYRTSLPGLYAIGDIIATPALAHVASAEGIACVEAIAGKKVTPIDYKNIPGCTYTTPEVASVGFTEKKALEAGYRIKVGRFPFSASGKASAAGEKEGFVKLIFDETYGELLGAHLVGSHVTEMISELVVARKLEITGEELLKTIHPHPTLSEAVMEAAAAAYGEVIHL